MAEDRIDDGRRSGLGARFSRMTEKYRPGLIATALALAFAALGCEAREDQAPAVEQHPARVAETPKSPEKPLDSEGRVVIEIRADDKVTLHADGEVLGTYSDGPSLRVALEALGRKRPKLAEHSSIRLPMVFGYEAPKEFWQAIDAAGYRHVFGARLVDGGPSPAGHHTH